MGDSAGSFRSLDTGIGIAKEDQEAIFEEFRQVGSNYAHKREGTGLGLTLTRKFVELHGGKIWVESEVGKGSNSRLRYRSSDFGFQIADFGLGKPENSSRAKHVLSYVEGAQRRQVEVKSDEDP